MEDENKKRKGNGHTGDVAVKRPKMAENADVTGENQEHEEEEEDNMLAWLTLDEETALELSKLLDDADTASSPFKVRFTDDSYTSSVVFQSSSAYVTINGNEESCGSSFSESESSLMASVDVSGMKRKMLGAGNSGAWILHDEVARGLVEECGDVEGFFVNDTNGLDHRKDVSHDEDEDDDDMWIKFLGEDSFGPSQ